MNTEWLKDLSSDEIEDVIVRAYFSGVIDGVLDSSCAEKQVCSMKKTVKIKK